MAQSENTHPSSFETRLAALSEDHQRGIRRFHERLVTFYERDGLLTAFRVRLSTWL